MDALCLFNACDGKDGSAAVLKGHYDVGGGPEDVNDDHHGLGAGADRKLAREEQHVQAH